MLFSLVFPDNGNPNHSSQRIMMEIGQILKREPESQSSAMDKKSTKTTPLLFYMSFRNWIHKNSRILSFIVGLQWYWAMSHIGVTLGSNRQGSRSPPPILWNSPYSHSFFLAKMTLWHTRTRMWTYLYGGQGGQYWLLWRVRGLLWTLLAWASGGHISEIFTQNKSSAQFQFTP